MASSDIITGQFVRISQTPASVGERIVARIIDIVLLVVYLISTATVLVYSQLLNDDITRYLSLLVIYLPAAFYSFLCEMFNHGQSLGKYIMKIRVVQVDGSSPSMGSLLLRWVLILIDIYFNCIGLVFIICTKKHQRLGDLAAGTMVIEIADYRKMHISLDEFYYARRDYKPVYSEAQQLSVGQIDVIKKALYGTQYYNIPQIDALSAKVKKFLGIQPKSTDNVKFLTTILHDYQYYAMELI
jgi:uncharacterized RDD family membrane protein YckC